MQARVCSKRLSFSKHCFFSLLLILEGLFATILIWNALCTYLNADFWLEVSTFSKFFALSVLAPICSFFLFVALGLFLFCNKNLLFITFCEHSELYYACLSTENVPQRRNKRMFSAVFRSWVLQSLWFIDLHLSANQLYHLRDITFYRATKRLFASYAFTMINLFHGFPRYCFGACLRRLSIFVP